MARAKRISNREIVDWFLDACGELEKHSFRQHPGMPRIRAVSGAASVRVLAEHPNETHLGDFVRQLRILLSPREPIHVDAVRMLLEEIVVDDDLNRQLASAGAAWKERDSQSFTIVHDEQAVHARDAWNLILNGQYMHCDVDKRRRAQALDDQNLLWLYQLKFYSFIEHASTYVLDVGTVADQALHCN